jgi:hypothetical protein
MRESPVIRKKCVSGEAGWLRLLVVLLLAAFAAGCATSRSYPLITDAKMVAIDLCANGAAVPPVSGQLGGAPSASPDYVWLTKDDGSREFLVWPAGFTVTFEPGAIVRNERGEVVAHDGETLVLPQTSGSDHAGTVADPIPAVGMVGGRCYYEGQTNSGAVS